MARRKAFRRKLLTKKYKELEGLDKLVAQLNDIGEGVEGDRVYSEALMPAAVLFRDEVRSRVPVDPNHNTQKSGPHIRDVIFASEGDPAKDPRGPNVLVGIKQSVLRPTNRAVLLEYGTIKTPAQPFWRPGMRAARPQAASTIANGLKKIIEDAAGR